MTCAGFFVCSTCNICPVATMSATQSTTFSDFTKINTGIWTKFPFTVGAQAKDLLRDRFLRWCLRCGFFELSVCMGTNLCGACTWTLGGLGGEGSVRGKAHLDIPFHPEFRFSTAAWIPFVSWLRVLALCTGISAGRSRSSQFTVKFSPRLRRSRWWML